MTSSVTLSEWTTATPSTHTALRGRSLSDEDARKQARALDDAGMLRVRELREGLEIETRSYVGRVRLGELTLSVQPKVGGTLLLSLFRYAYGLRNLSLHGDAEFATGELLPDILIAQLLHEVRELHARGLARRYARTEETLDSPRGRIDVGRIGASGGLVTAGLLCVHHPRSSDTVLNRALLGGLHLARNLTRDLDLRRAAARLAAVFAGGVGECPLDRAILTTARRSLNRLVATYEPALQLIELLMTDVALSLDDGRSARLPGFMLDMNRFFQALVSRLLIDYLPDVTVKTEHSLRGMLSYNDRLNPRSRRSPTPRPDIVLFRRGQPVGIFDAKYRDLWNTTLPRSMLYQLALYALADRTHSTAIMLYPTMASDATDAAIEVRDPVTGDFLACIVARPIVLPRLALALGAGGDALGLARALVAFEGRPRA